MTRTFKAWRAPDARKTFSTAWLPSRNSLLLPRYCYCVPGGFWDLHALASRTIRCKLFVRFPAIWLIFHIWLFWNHAMPFPLIVSRVFFRGNLILFSFIIFLHTFFFRKRYKFIHCFEWKRSLRLVLIKLIFYKMPPHLSVT